MSTFPDTAGEELRRKAEDAKAAYLRAKGEYEQLMAISAETANINDPGFVDGTAALLRALKVHTHARERYQQALRDLTEYILDGKLPPVE